MKLAPGLVELTVDCDLCLRVETYVAHHPAQADDLADADGWLRNKACDRDVCASCLATRAGFDIPRMLL